MSNLGVRNNNWLNVRFNPANDWVGQTGSDENNYAQFEDPLYGLRAADRVLENYGTKHNINTLNEAIFRFAPPADNNPSSVYAEFVADEMGISVNDEINLENPDTREQMISAMVKFETPDAASTYDSNLLAQARNIDNTQGIEAEGIPNEFIKDFFNQQSAESAETNVAITDSRTAAAQAAFSRDPALSPERVLTGDLPELEALPSAGLVDGFFRGVKSGAERLDSDLYYFGAAIDALQGDEQGVKDSVRNARIQEEFAALPMQGLQTFSEFVDEPTVEGALDQIYQGTGQLVPNAISTIVGAGVGSVGLLLGKEVLTQTSRQAVKNIIKDSVGAVRNKVATPDQRNIAQAAFEAAKEASVLAAKTGVRKGRGRDLKIGGIGGAFVSEFMPLGGSNVSEALESGREIDRDNAIRALTVALPQAGVGVLGEVGLVSLIAKQATAKSAGPNSVMGRLADTLGRKFLKGGAIEGTTELIQEEIAIQNRASMDPDFSDADKNLRRLNALYVGFFGGGSLAGAGATAVQAVKEIPAVTGNVLDAAAVVTEKAADMTDSIKERMTRTQADAEIADVEVGQTTPEADRDIEAQLAAMVNPTSSKEAVWIAGTEPDSRFFEPGRRRSSSPRRVAINGQQAFAQFIPGRGTIVTTDPTVLEEVVKGGATDSVLASALGYSSVKTDADSLVVRVFDKDGGIVSEQTTTVEGLPDAQEAAKALTPEGGRNEVLTIEDALAQRTRRQGPEIEFMEDDDTFGSFDELQQEMEARGAFDNERIGDAEFEAETTTYTFVQGGLEKDRYQPVPEGRVEENIDQARRDYNEATGQEVDFSSPTFATAPATMLKTAARLQQANPNELVNIEANPDGTFRIDITTTADTQKIRIRDGRGKESEVSIDEFIRLSLSQAQQSNPEFRNVRVKYPESDNWVSVNLVDLMNAGRRLEESESGFFTGEGPVQSARQGLITMLAELQARGYELEIQDVPLNDILDNLANPRKDLDPKIANVTAGFDNAGDEIPLSKVLSGYVPGPSKVTPLEQTEDGRLIPQELALEEEQANREGVAEVAEIGVDNARTVDGIPLTRVATEDIDAPDSRRGAQGEYAKTGTGPAVEITKGPDYNSGVTFPFGEVNTLISSLIRRLSRKIKLKNPVAVISLKGFEKKVRNQIKSFIKGQKTAKGRIALKNLEQLDLRNIDAVGQFMQQLKKDGLLKKSVLWEGDIDNKSVGYTTMLRALKDTLSPLTNSPAATDSLARTLGAALDSSAKNYKGIHKRFDGGTVIIIDDLNNSNEAALTMVAAHEMGHALFKEEIDAIQANKALYGRLLKAFQQDVQRARDDGNPIPQWENFGFEEWYADQIAAWVKKDAEKDARASNAVDSHFKKVVKRFKELWAAMKNHASQIYRRTNTVQKPFEDYMNNVIKARRDNREVITSPVYDDDGNIVAYTSALGSIRQDGTSDMAQEARTSEPAPETETAPVTETVTETTAPDAVPEETTEDTVPSEIPAGTTVEPTEASFEQKAVVKAVRDAIKIQTGADARAAMWRKKFRQMSADFLAKNPNALKIMGLLFTADSTLRWAAGNDVADMFYIRSNDKGGLGFVQERQLARDRWRAGLFEVIGTDWTTAEVQNALLIAQGGTPTNEITNPKAKAIREFLEQFHREYIEPSNTNIGFRENYFPVLLNLQEVTNDPEAFIEMIMDSDPEADRAQIKLTVDRLIKYQQMLDDDDVDPAAMDIINPGAAVEANIELTKNVSPTILRDLGYVQEPEVALLNYIDNITKRVEWNRSTRTADGKDILQDLLKDLPRRNRESAESVINAYLGNTTHLSPFWRKANSYLQAINLVTLLPFAVFASIPDFAGAIVQTKEFNGFTMFAKEVVKQIQDREAAKRLANDIGVVMPEAAANAWMSQLDSDMLDPTVRKATDKFFQWTGLTALTTLSREVASGMAKRFLIEHANHPTNRSERYLRQLGVTAEQVKAWEANSYSFDGPEGDAIKGALVRFVESSVLRPNSAERPVWASDPRFALIWQLKSFVYAFNKVILQGLEREFATRLIRGEGLGPATAPLMLITMAAFMPLAALGLELREYAKVGLSYALPGIDGSLKYLRTDKMDYGTYFTELFSRAGLDGPLGLITMAQRSDDYGGSALASLAGPTVELAEVAITDGPFDAAFTRMNSPQELTGTLLGVGAAARAIF